MSMQKTTRGLWKAIEEADPAKQGVIVSCDYGPQTEAENQPMAVRSSGTGFARRVPVLLASMYVETTPLSNRALEQVVAEVNAARRPMRQPDLRRDYVNSDGCRRPSCRCCRWGPASARLPRRLGWAGHLDAPLLQRIKNYSDAAIVVSISGGSIPLSYVSIVQPRFGSRSRRASPR